MEKILLDTNVMLDVFTGREPFRDAAEQLLLMIAEGSVLGFITASQITDIYYILHRYVKSEEKIREILNKIFTLFEIVPVMGQSCKKALTLNMNDYEDALISVCAKGKNIDYIITRNEKDFIHSLVQIKSPLEYLQESK